MPFRAADDARTLDRRQTKSTADGQALIYWSRAAPAPGNRHLLLVHGGASNHGRWSEFADNTQMAREWGLLAPDLRELDRETRKRLRGADSFEAIAREYRALGPILRYMPTANYLRQVLETVRPLPPLDGIDVPVLVLLSGGTTIASIEQNKRECAAFRDSEVIVLDANHWPLTETPEAVREAIDAWVVRRFGTSAWENGGCAGPEPATRR